MLEVVAQLQRRDEFIRGLYERYYETHGYEWIPDTPETVAARAKQAAREQVFVRSYYLDVRKTQFNLDPKLIEGGGIPNSCPFKEE